MTAHGGITSRQVGKVEQVTVNSTLTCLGPFESHGNYTSQAACWQLRYSLPTIFKVLLLWPVQPNVNYTTDGVFTLTINWLSLYITFRV